MTPLQELNHISPSQLRPAEYNPRRISAEQLRRLAALIDKHGFIDPVIARAEDYLIIGGHQRVKALKYTQAEHKTIPVILLSGISDTQAKQVNIALNNPAAQGDFDTDLLSQIIRDIKSKDIDVATGFSMDEIDDFLVEFEDIDVDDFINVDEGSQRQNGVGERDLSSETETIKYVLSGQAAAFSEEIIAEVRKIVCPEGITLRRL